MTKDDKSHVHYSLVKPTKVEKISKFSEQRNYFAVRLQNGGMKIFAINDKIKQKQKELTA